MNPQERSLLENFLSQLVQIRTLNKDPEADKMIRQAVDRQPDAAYLLVQRALLLSEGLDQAKARIAALEQAQGESSSGGGFLSGGGSGWNNPGGPSYSAPPGFSRPPAQPAQYAAAPYPPAAGYAPPPSPGFGSGVGSFLGQAAATAAGVAGGEFLFEGLENMFGHHGGAPFGGLAPQPFPTEDVTINNYYPEDPRTEDFRESRPDGDDERDPGTYTADDLDPGVFTDDPGDDAPTDDSDLV